MKYKKIEVRNLVLAGIATLTLGHANAFADGRPAKASDALNCSVPSSANKYRGTCPYPYQVYKGDPVFKRVFDATREKYGIPDLKGPESPMESVSISGEKYIKGSQCEAHSCGEHNVYFFYSVSRQRLVGIYYAPGQANAKWFGDPTELETKKLLEP